jgi:hypothetical protein
MPKTNIDYSKALIYKIVCLDENVKDCYVGLTTDLVRRKYAHKHHYAKKDTFVYEFIKVNGGWENWKFEIITFCNECSNKKECEDLETYYINNLTATLNSAKFDKKNYTKNWYLEKRTEIKEKRKEEKEIYEKYWKSQYDITHNPEWYLNNINNRKIEV